MKKDWIQTYLGKKFYPLAPRIADLNIRDQAHALSMCCRYAGHVSSFYSVAEHAVRVSRRLALLGNPLPIQKWGLIHDNSEAYLGDVTRPLKHTPAMAGYRAAEARLQRLIAKWLHLPLAEPGEVATIDTQILGTEIDALKQPIHPDWASTTATGKLWQPWSLDADDYLGWSPYLAEKEYLILFERLWGTEAAHAAGL